jgi:hypothetical protein
MTVKSLPKGIRSAPKLTQSAFPSSESVPPVAVAYPPGTYGLYCSVISALMSFLCIASHTERYWNYICLP